MYIANDEMILRLCLQVLLADISARHLLQSEE